MLRSWNEIESLESLKLLLLSYQDGRNAAGDFTVLEKFFDSLHPQQKKSFLKDSMPFIMNLAHGIKTEFPIPKRLCAGQVDEIELTKEEISQILANAFCCRFRGVSSYVNFDRLFARGNRDTTKVEKLKCVVNYFENIKAIKESKTSATSLSEKVTFKRVVTSEAPLWERSNVYLKEFVININDSMFDCPNYMAEVDFANKRIGGGALGNGCVQEEIKFITCPELIVAKAFCDDLRDNEALIMTGAEPYSAFTGYASTFKFAGDAKGRNGPKVVVAIDALDFSRLDDSQQFSKKCIDRELLKAYTGFVNCPKDWIATGNWGCGAFQGDPELKMKIQWVAASMANKKLCYFSYNDVGLEETFYRVHKSFSARKVGEAYKLLLTHKNEKYELDNITRLIFWGLFIGAFGYFNSDGLAFLVRNSVSTACFACSIPLCVTSGVLRRIMQCKIIKKYCPERIQLLVHNVIRPRRPHQAHQRISMDTS